MEQNKNIQQWDIFNNHRYVTCNSDRGRGSNAELQQNFADIKVVYIHVSKWTFFFYFHAFSVRVTLFVGICPTLLFNKFMLQVSPIYLVCAPPSSSPQLQRLVTTSLIALNGTYTRHNLVLLSNFIFFIFKISCVVNMGTFNFQIEFKSQYKVTRKKQSLIMNIFLICKQSSSLLLFTHSVVLVLVSIKCCSLLLMILFMNIYIKSVFRVLNFCSTIVRRSIQTRVYVLIHFKKKINFT